MEYRVTVDGRPVPKARPRFANGHAFTPKKTHDYEKLVKYSFLSQNKGAVKLDGAIEVKCMFFYKRPKRNQKTYYIQRPDVDNLAKSALDALNGVAWVDDEQIVHLDVSKRYADEYGAEIIIKPLEDTKG